MSCRRICRELLWLARFGELGPSSAPHLDHLADCRSCRDEVGYDRQLVKELRIALAARIEAATPPSDAWHGILARTQHPEPRGLAAVWARFGGLAVRLRTGTAMAGMGLALVLTLNMQLVPMGAPAADQPDRFVDEPADVQLSRVAPDSTLFGAAPDTPDDIVAERNDIVLTLPDPEGITAQVARPSRTQGGGAEQPPSAEEPATDPQLQLVFRAPRMPELVGAPDNGEARGPRPAPDPIDMRPGQPF